MTRPGPLVGITVNTNLARLVRYSKCENGRAQDRREERAETRMRRYQTKVRSVRKALRDVSNESAGGGRFSKPVNAMKKSIVSEEKKMEKQQSVRVRGGEDDCLDRLLFVQSDLSSLTRQIDELVAEAFKLNPINKEARCEIESFTSFLSNTLSALKPWMPRFQKLLSAPSVEAGVTEKVCDLNEDEGNFDIDSPEESKFESLISPSPLVSWRAGCGIERGGGRQLFLLTPLPMSKTLSFKRQELSKSVFERVNSVELPSVLMISEDVNDDSCEGIAVKATPCKAVVSEAKTATGCRVVSSPAVFSKGDSSMLVMTPRLKISPPKSCVLLEPISESSHKGNEKMRKSTPFPVGIHSHISDSSSSDGSEDLSLRYPELLGIQHGYKSRVGNNKLDESPQWSFSPPKTCILLDPSDEKLAEIVATDHALPVNAPILTETDVEHNCHQIKSNCKGIVTGRSNTFVESTHIWKEPDSTLRTGKPPGENTLKRELWTKFEAASSYGFRVNASALRKTSRKGFLDMLDEASCDGESAVAADGFR